MFILFEPFSIPFQSVSNPFPHVSVGLFEVCIKADSTEMVSHGVMSVLTKLAEESGGKVMGGEWEVEDGGARATRRLVKGT